MKSSDPVKLRPSTIASGGRGANQTSGVTSRVNGGIVLVGMGRAVTDGTDMGMVVEIGVVSGRLQDEITNINMNQSEWIFMAYTFLLSIR